MQPAQFTRIDSVTVGGTAAKRPLVTLSTATQESFPTTNLAGNLEYLSRTRATDSSISFWKANSALKSGKLQPLSLVDHAVTVPHVRRLSKRIPRAQDLLSCHRHS